MKAMEILRRPRKHQNQGGAKASSNRYLVQLVEVSKLWDCDVNVAKICRAMALVRFLFDSALLGERWTTRNMGRGKETLCGNMPDSI